MNHFVASAAFLAFLAGAGAAAAAPTACGVLSEAEAARLVGGVLGETSQHEAKPEAQNGSDRKSDCAHLPKGYRFETADGPPARGILVELHAMRSADDARRFYQGVLGMHIDNAKSPGARPDAAVMMVTGFGEAGYLKPTMLADPAARIITLTFLKGSVVASVQVWTTATPVEPIARAAAAQVAARLP